MLNSFFFKRVLYTFYMRTAFDLLCAVVLYQHYSCDHKSQVNSRTLIGSLGSKYHEAKNS